MHRTKGHSKNQLYSEDEVTNPGYPGALVILAVPLLLIGLTGLSATIAGGDLIGTALLSALFLLPGAVLVIKSARARRVQRREPWACPTCDYDRRNLAPGAKCPECGAPPSDVTPNPHHPNHSHT